MRAGPASFEVPTGAVLDDTPAMTLRPRAMAVPMGATPTKAKWRARVELQVESMSGFAVRVFLYSWYTVLLVGLVAQAYNVELQWEARELCGADRVSLDALAAWNSSACMETQKYWVPADDRPHHAPPPLPSSFHHTEASGEFYWLDAPPLTELFVSPPPPPSMEEEEITWWRGPTTTTTTTTTTTSSTSTTTSVPKPTMHPLNKRYAVRWTSSKAFSSLLDHRVNRFTHVLLSLASPMTNMTDPAPPGMQNSNHHQARPAPRYRYYFLRVALEEEPFDPTADDDSSSHSDSGSVNSSDNVDYSGSASSQSASALSSSSSSSGSSSSSSSSSGSDSSAGPRRLHYVYNASITCYVDRPRCSTLVLPRTVAVVTSRNESRFSLTLLDVEPELALASTIPSAVGIWYQRGFYTLSTLIWRCVFLAYSVLSCCRFAYRSRRVSDEENSDVGAAPHEQYGIWLLQLSFLCYLDPLFVPGVYEWARVPTSVYHFLEFHFPNYFLASLLCFCFVMSVASGTTPVDQPRADTMSAARRAIREDAGGRRPPPPPWVFFVTIVYLIVVFVLDVSQGFFEDRTWGTEVVCEESICRGLRVGLNVTLMAGFVVVLITLWWLRKHLAALPYLDTRPQQLIGRMLIFVLSSCVLYLIAITVMMTALHAQVLDLVYFQPLTQFGPMVVATALVNHLTYLFTPISASSRVPVRPSNPIWKRVRWSQRWFRWLDMHGGSLYVFATEEEERQFMAIQRRPPSSPTAATAGPASARHGQRRASRADRARRGGTPTPTTTPPPPPPPPTHDDANAVDSGALPSSATARFHDNLPLDNEDQVTDLFAASSRFTSRADSFMADSIASEASASTSSRTSVATGETPLLSRSAVALALGLASPDPRVPPLRGGGRDTTAVPSPTAESHSARGAPDGAQPQNEVVDDGAGWRPGARFSHTPPTPRAGTGAVLSLLHGAEHTLVDGTGQLMDILEEALLARPLYAVLHSRQRSRQHRSGNTALARRHYFFNVETAMDCFNMAWEAYAVTASDGDALIETGMNVAPDAVVSGMERLFLWLFTRLFAWKRQYDAQAANPTADDDGDDDHAVAVHEDGDEEGAERPALSATPNRPTVCHREDGLAAVEDGTEPATSPDLSRARQSTSAGASPEATLVPRLRTLNPGRYGHTELAVFEMIGVQVIVTALDPRAGVHAGKTPRLMVSFRGTDNVANAVQDMRFHQRVWREMPGRLLAVRPTVHSGFLEMWMQLKERVLNAVLDALQRAYIFSSYPETDPSAEAEAGAPPTALPTWRHRPREAGAAAPPRPAHHDAIPSEGPDAFADVFVTGHSLGGALACLCAYSLHRALSLVHYPRPDVCVYTFGQPRLGNTSFREAYNKAVPHTFRVVNESDAVAGWRIWSGHHVGQQVSIDRRGNYVCKPMAIERLLRPTGGPGLAVLNHAMAAYAASLNAVADRIQQASSSPLWGEPTGTPPRASDTREDDEATGGLETEPLRCPPPLRCLVPCGVSGAERLSVSLPSAVFSVSSPTNTAPSP